MKPSNQVLKIAFFLVSLGIGVYVFTTDIPAEESSAADKSASTAQHGRAFLRASGTGPAYWGPGDLYTFLATGEETNNAYFQMEALVPKGGGPPPHIHLQEEETFYLAEGTLEMHLGEKTVVAKAGDFINVPRGTLHGFKNVGNETAKMIVTFVPAGFEKYFEEVFPLAQDRSAAPPPVTDELIQRMIAAAPKHGCKIPPPPAPAQR